MRTIRAFALALLGLVALAACGSTATADANDNARLTLRIGYFPNLTHAPALAGLKQGLFAKALGSSVTIEEHTFNAGGDAVTAILSGSIDATFVGPNPAVNAYVQSHGEAVRIISGATSGGAELVVRPGIASPAALKGKKIADPQLGGTQDVALRWYLKQQGFNVDSAGGGDVSVLPQDNSVTLTAFRQGQIDGAWVPEPWASRLVVEGGGRVLVDERDLWPGGQFETTNLLVSKQFLDQHPKRVKALLEGLYQSIQFLNTHAAQAQQITNDAVAGITGKKLAAGVVAAAWPHMTFTLDPVAPSVKTSADHAHTLGLLASANLSGLFALTLVNQVLAEHGQPAVRGL